MTPDPRSVADAYLALWNETDPAARRRLLDTHWQPDARYADPMADVQGAEQIDALVGGVQQRFPGFRFALRGRPDGHGDHIRFSWALGRAGAEPPVEGSDVVELRAGRIGRVVGFLDKLPG